MEILSTLLVLLGFYRLLPREVRAAVETVATALVEQAIQAAGAGAAERMAGSPELRSVHRYLAKSIALTLREYPQLDAVAFALDFGKPPVSDCLLQVLTRPEADLDHLQVVRAFKETHYDLDSLGVDPVDLLRRVQRRFKGQLKADAKTRDIWLAAVVERVAADTAALRADLEQRSARERAASPLLSVEEYFGPWLRPNRLFSHSWTIVGRTELQDRLAEFAGGGAPYQLAVLPGRGGIGKSRLLLALADRVTRAHPKVSVRIAAESQLIAADDLAALPDGRVLLLIDDAHRRDELELVLSTVRRARQPIQVVMATRPYGTDSVRAAAARVGFDRNEVLLLPELTELGHPERIALAREALGEDHAHLAEALADVTRDSPLVTVVGGQLLAQESVAPGLLAQHDEFRRAVLGRMANEYVEALREVLEPARARRALELVAAIGPVATSHGDLIARAAEFLGIRPDELQRALGKMEEAGILLRRGGSVRITPDVLADYLYHEAAITGNRPTGYSDEVFRRFSDIIVENVLSNLAELDWRARHTQGEAIDLLAVVWADVEESFRHGTHYDRIEILKMLERIAVFQPYRALQLVELALQRSEPGGLDDSRYLIHSWSAEDVIAATPPLLRRIAYHPEYRIRAFDLLWEIGRDDERSLNGHPNHPVRILSDLAGYDSQRLEMAVSVLDAVERWIDRDGIGRYAHSELDLIDPILEKAGSRMTPVGHQLTFQPYFVNPDATRKVRDHALHVVHRFTEEGELHALMRAVESLSHALRNPMGHFGASPSDDLLDRWVPEQLQVIERMRVLSERAREPMVVLAVLETISWHALHGRSELREAARDLARSVDWTFELLLTKHLTDRRYRLDLLEEMEGDPETEGVDGDPAGPRINWEEREKRLAVERENLADALVHKFPQPEMAFPAIEERLQTAANARQGTAAGEFLSTLANRHPDHGEVLARICLVQPRSMLAGWMAALLGGLRPVRANAAIGLIEEAAVAPHPVMRAAAAATCMQTAYANAADQRDIQVLRELLRDDDKWVLRAALRAMAALPRSHAELALQLAMEVELGSDGEAADELFGALSIIKGAREFGGLAEAVTRALLAKLDAVIALDGYWTGQFLNYAAEIVPRDVVQLFLRRVRREREGVAGEFRVMPFRFENSLSGFGAVDGREALLAEIRDEFFVSTGSERFWIPRLFAAVSQGFDSIGREILNEWIGSGEPKKIRAAAALLGASEWQFAVRNVDFVRDLIRSAEAAGSDVLGFVLSVLHGAVASRGGTGTPGEPMPHDIEARDEARRIAGSLPVGSAERAFFEQVAAEAEEEIRRGLERDAEFES